MKKWYRSKTLWFNVLCSSLVALEGVTGLLQPYVGQSFYVVMCVVLPIGNAMLRVISTEGLTK